MDKHTVDNENTKTILWPAYKSPSTAVKVTEAERRREHDMWELILMRVSERMILVSERGKGFEVSECMREKKKEGGSYFEERVSE